MRLGAAPAGGVGPARRPPGSHRGLLREHSGDRVLQHRLAAQVRRHRHSMQQQGSFSSIVGWFDSIRSFNPSEFRVIYI